MGVGLSNALWSHACRGTRKQYYSGDFIADNEVVADHLSIIGHFANVSYEHACTCIMTIYLQSIFVGL